MEELKYIQEREKRAVRSTVTGIALTVSMHVALFAIFFNTGFTYLDPPPPEKDQGLKASPAVGERSSLSFSARFRPENSRASVREMAEGGPG